MVLFR